MPLFNRRSRSVSVARPTTPVATNPALLAASQAFNNTEAGQKKLAQGAAAAALRSMSPTSTPVGQIQTKRMMERQSSVGAGQSAQRGRGRPNNMVRRSSSSSMTERTFREPSPGRPSTASGVPPPRQFQPPVPRVPDNYANIPPVPKKTQRRSASIDEIQMRKNGQPQGRNTYRDSTYAQPPAPNPASAAAKRVTSAQNAPVLARSDSNNSVNFSYPGRSRPISPPPQKQFFDSPRQEAPALKPVKPASAISGISETEARNIQRDLTQVAQQPVKKKKKKDSPLAEGSHLQASSTGARPKVHPLEPGPEVVESIEHDQEPEQDRSRNRARLTGQASHFPASPTSPSDASQASDSDSATERTRARRALRAAGALQKQPSVVREDWEGEQEEIPSSPVEPSPQPRIASKKRDTLPANISRKIESAPVSAPQPQQTQRDPITTPQSLTAPQTRKPSLSPSRSTRFSNRLSSDITEGQRHNPPPRSVSPRKPALKHVPSPQALAIDRVRDSSLSPSEGTDVSYDGMPKRGKKSAHVKFDSHPAIVGIAAEPDPQLVSDSPVVVSPQYREQPKKRYAMTKKPQGRSRLSDDSDDEDTMMKPRPQLPTFGSVRNRRNDQDSSPIQPTVSPSSSSSSSVSSVTPPATMNTSISSDHAIGAILSREQEQKRAAASQTQQSSPRTAAEERAAKRLRDYQAFEGDRISPPPVITQQHPAATNQGKENGLLPSIAVLPATPGAEEENKHNDQWLVEVPGGFPSASHQSTTQSLEPSVSQASSTVTSSAATDHTYDDQYQPVDRMAAIQEESDHDSIYSDAAEDLSDLEGDGFGSIAAIVHSPVTSTPSRMPEFDSPAPTAPQRNVVEESDGKDHAWEDTSARWKGLAENAKRTTLQPAAPIVERTTQTAPSYEDEDELDSPPESPENSPLNHNQGSSYHAVTTDPDQERTNVRTSVRTPTPELTAKNTLRNSKPSNPENFAPNTMRNSMRGPPPQTEAVKPFRSSMRDGGANVAREENSRSMRASMRESASATREDAPKSMRLSMRDSGAATRNDSVRSNQAAVPARTSSGASAAALLAAKPAPAQRAVLQKRNSQPAAAAPASTLRQLLPPVQDDSDSDSSFRKRRRAKVNDASRYSMRRSMRVDAAPPPPPASATAQATKADRRAVRSLSPVQRRPFSPVGEQSAFRTTMRGATGNTNVTADRPQPTARRSSSLFGRKKDAVSPTRPLPLRLGSASRTADSDDDRKSRPKVYKSRFQDSDDEEESGFRPVRGIPRKAKDDDSTDLEDSSDEEKSRKTAGGQNPTSTTQYIQPSIERPTSPTSPDGKKKRSFFGRLRKNKDEPSNTNIKESEPVISGDEEVIDGKQSASSAALGFSTDAEKDALVEETLRKLEAAKDQTPEPEIRAPPQRIVPQRHKSDSWPLVPKIVDDDNRPFTADGDASRPSLQRNSSSGTPTPSSPGGSSTGKTGKKKRFPLLRKAFGLKD